MNHAPDRLNALTEKIIGCAFHVHNELGRGFLEKVYENALLIELTQHGLSVQQQQPLPVFYKGHLVGDYIADLIVEECVIIELKAIIRLTEEHTAQGINYLTATRLPICLVLNFAKSVEVKRLVGPTFPSPSEPQKSVFICVICGQFTSCRATHAAHHAPGYNARHTIPRRKSNESGRSPARYLRTARPV